MKNVYLSHAPEDSAAAEELRRALLARGYRPWVDPQPAPGAVWHHQIEAAITAADALILLLSAAAAASCATTYEWALAVGAGVPLFAIIHEETDEHPRLQLARRYDRRAFKDENQFWDHFMADFARQLERAAADKRGTVPKPATDLEIDRSVRPTEPGYWIVMRRGPLPNTMYQLERAVVGIGRDSANDIAIRDAQVSRFHLRLSLESQAYRLEDLGSTNGTNVNGLQISRPVRLNDGDIIALGDSILLTYDLVYLE